MVCNFLDAAPKDKNDWVVTTAFYSALHFARHKIFPYEMETAPGQKKEFECFDEYYEYHQSINKPTNKHEVMKRLVRMKVAAIADQYDHLHGLAHNARYNDWNLDKHYSKAAKKALKAIKDACNA